MADLGAPVSHLALRDGVPVFDRDGQDIGVVERVMTDEATGIFEGLVIHSRPLVPGRHLYAGHEQIAALRERGVRLAVARDELHDLDARAGRRSRRDVTPESPAEAALRKAWDWLVGTRP
jgi:PRC-barrel domain